MLLVCLGYLTKDRGQYKTYLILIIKRPPLNYLYLSNTANGQFGYLGTNSMPYRIIARHKKEELLKWHARTKKAYRLCVEIWKWVNACRDSFTILGFWVLGLAVSHINESNCKLMSPEHFFFEKSAILLHPGTRWNKNFASQKQNYAQKMQDAQVTNHCSLCKWSSAV